MSDPVVEVSGFSTMGLDERLISTIEYKQPSPIQRETIPLLLEGKDVIGLAGTGTGKTAAFALPILHRLRANPAKKQGVAVLILTPTRELAIQVAKAIKQYGKPLKVEVLAVYGGTGYREQIVAIRRGAEVVVATPGRALDLIKNGQLPLDAVTTVVLDEADEMLNMGFAEDMDAILSQTPKDRQTMLFSATMPPRIEQIAQVHLRKPVRIQVARELPARGQEAAVRQTAYIVPREQKGRALGRILDVEQPTAAIIFCRTRSDVDGLCETMASRGYKPQALHGGFDQEQRDRVMGRFRAGTADLLIATDIAARGLDIAHLSHVINFDVPTDADQYVHRIGRVGRAGRAGVAITLATSREQQGLGRLERVTKQRITVAQVPTVKDLKAAKLNRTRQQMRDALGTLKAADDLRGLLGELTKEFSETDIALAALTLLRPPVSKDDETEIGGGGFAPRPAQPQGFTRDRIHPDIQSEEAWRVGRRPTARGMTKVYFGIGRDAGVVVRDLVGAISEEAGIPSKDLGAIDLTSRFALVEVPAGMADYVVEAMQGARIRGRVVNVRPDRPPQDAALPGRAAVHV